MPSSKRARARVPAAARAQLAAAAVWADRLLGFCARWGVPAALGFAIVSGPLLPRIGGGLAPYPGLRSLHVLCGVALALDLLVHAGAWGVGAAQWLWLRQPWLWLRRPWLWLRRPWPWRRRRQPVPRGGGLGRGGLPGRVGLFALHGVLLAAMLWTGLERYAGQRWGRALAPVLSASEWSLLHGLLAPYYVAALLVYWFVKSRLAWRTLLDQLRRP
jgi:hypothetical protein